MKRKKLEIDLNEKRMRSIIELEERERQLEIDLKRQKAHHEQEMERRRADQEHDLKRIAALSNASVEALMTMAGPEQAKLLRELKDTEALKGMSAEEIMAMKDPAALGRAFEEKYKGSSKDEIEKLYKMVMETKDKSLEDKEKSMDRIERIVSKAFDKGVGQPGWPSNPNPSVIYPPQGQPGFYPSGPMPGQPGVVNVNQMSQSGVAPDGQPESKVCINPECKAIIKISLKFCPKCGSDQTIKT